MRTNPLRTAVGRTFLVLLLSMAVTLSAQRYEIGVQGGMANLVGDVGRTGYILQKPLGNISDFGLPFYTGLIYRMNFNPYQTLRFDLGVANIQFSDPHAKEQYRKNRRGYGINNVYNADAQFEYNFFPVNNEQKGMLSPYIFGGIGAMVYSDRQVVLDFTSPDNTTNILNDYDGDGKIDVMPKYPELYNNRASTKLVNQLVLSVPFGAGLKYKFNYNWAVFGEFKFRYTLTDNIDYSNLKDKNVKVLGKVSQYQAATDPANLPVYTGDRKLTSTESAAIRDPYVKDQQIGNINSKDWVNAVTIGISYSFGRPPCYCD